MNPLVPDASPHRRLRAGSSPGSFDLRVLVALGGWLLLGAAAGWWCRVSGVHTALTATRNAALAWDQRLSAQWPAERRALPPQPDVSSDVRRAEAGHDDVSALVQWHAVLQQHQLHEWQGRSVPAAQAPSGSDQGEGGAWWRLEGRAGYEQGVALLNDMAHQFPRLVMSQVRVQQIPASELLQWRLDLRWSAPLPARAQRWSPGETRQTSSWVNPFAAHRLPEYTTASPVPRADRAGVHAHHVLPQAPWTEIRLIGVLGQDEERVALVTWSRSTDAMATAGLRVPPVQSHRVRLGQTLGAEQTQVVAIQPQSMVLELSRNASAGRRSPRREVLALADASALHPTADPVSPHSTPNITSPRANDQGARP